MPNFLGSRLGFWSKNVTITSKTEINVFIDTSGSMNSSVAPLEEMVNNDLKDSLVQFYGDLNNYSVRSRSYRFSNERTWSILATPRRNIDSDSVFNLIFQDESDTAYSAPGTWNLARTSVHNADMNTLRTFYSNSPVPVYSIVFVVEGFADYAAYINAVKNGSGLYSGINGLSDKYLQKTFNVDLNVIDGGTSAYYKQKVKTALEYFNVIIP